MTLFRPLVWAALVVLLSAVLQGRLSHAIRVHGVQPDLILLTLSCAGVLLGGGRAALLGPWAGLLAAVMAHDSYGALLTSRALAGAFAGYLHRFVIRDSLVVPPLVVLLVTGAAETAFLLFAPGVALHPARAWALRTGGEVLYNAVLSLPLYFLLRRLGLGIPPEDPFGVRY